MATFSSSWANAESSGERAMRVSTFSSFHGTSMSVTVPDAGSLAVGGEAWCRNLVWTLLKWQRACRQVHHAHSLATQAACVTTALERVIHFHTGKVPELDLIHSRPDMKRPERHVDITQVSKGAQASPPTDRQTDGNKEANSPRTCGHQGPDH